ncbi:MAG TPA: tRNA (adenosine(37)-N6)-dimethylallyltransferase MiaA [Candidatus Saccharimonadales bacterium]|nr:tRNA (adenosine(37)-N6)-dimethylallyltransferase MiaA [Candidatus Saccharimonadales bacterium]
MAADTSGPKLVVIVGPTASGKSQLAMRLAKVFDGEIIAADSRTTYKGMDLGTAKPTRADQKSIKHWGLDLIKPGEQYSAASFKKYAEQVIDDIWARGKLPILVGGTGLYVDGILFDYQFSQPAQKGLRQELEAMDILQLQKIIRQRKYAMPENSQNKRYLMRTIEREGRNGTRRQKPPAGIVLIGLLPSDSELKKRIAARADKMFAGGVSDEYKKLINIYGRQGVLNTGVIVYRICDQLERAEIDENQARDLFTTADWQYARRQKTWFKRNKFIQWFNNQTAAYTSVSKKLNKQIGA